MKHRVRSCLPTYSVCACGIALVFATTRLNAQTPADGFPSLERPQSAGECTPEVQIAPPIEPWSNQRLAGADEDLAAAVEGNAAAQNGFVAGADFLFVRPHFSEAPAYARGSFGPGGVSVAAQELDFDYEASLRAFVGYRFDDGKAELRLTYTRLPGQASQDAANLGPSQFIVDPFGNVVGTAPGGATGGNRISVDAAASADIYDLELIKQLSWSDSRWLLSFSAGLRIASVDQSYESVVTSGGAFFGDGSYTADFVGAGPRLGLEGRWCFGPNREYSLFARGYGSLLVGDFDMAFRMASAAMPAPATQSSDIVRMIPVAEIEMGAAIHPCSWLELSAGWLFQTWIDLGDSGAKYGGYYTITQNANIMAFEGFFARAEVAF
jgi:Legionella pneumophila major outer membrane protein precursor